jgi:hypothetical protein
MYEQQQAEAGPAGAGAETQSDGGPAEEEVVDAEFSEVDEEPKA